jgi:alpha-L-fucosidase
MDDRVRWFADMRFGVFVHWGLYSIPAKGEWLMLYERWDPEEYKSAFLPRFNPKKTAPREWVAIAKEAGAEYMVFTTRHHDGFCLFDSKASVGGFTSINSPAAHDFVREYVEACREAGLRVGLYYSLADWRIKSHKSGEPIPANQQVLQKQAMEQVRELLTNYGKIDILWYDGPFSYDEKGPCWNAAPIDYKPAEMNTMARELQPGIVINDRSGLPEDFSTLEQHITEVEPGRMWESCMTMNENWGYHRWDDNWKSVEQLIVNLILCSAGGGSYLLNIGPTEDGSVPEPSRERLTEIGKWMRSYGHTLKNGVGVPFIHQGFPFHAIRQDNKLYVYIRNWPGKEARFIYCPVTVTAGRLLGSGKEIRVSQVDDLVSLLGLPDEPDDPYVSVVELDVAH